MKVFAEINNLIEQSAEMPDKEIHLGWYKFYEFDEEDKKELQSWIADGETLYSKIINDKTFLFDIKFPDDIP